MSCNRTLKVASILTLFLGIFPAANSALEVEPQLEYLLQPRSIDATLGETYYVDIYLKNNTSREITICKCYINGEILYADLDGGESTVAVDRYHTTDEPKETDFVTVMPGSTTKYSWAGFGKEYFHKAGKWMLEIRETYKSTPYVGSYRSWEGLIKSNSLTVTVREP